MAALEVLGSCGLDEWRALNLEDQLSTSDVLFAVDRLQAMRAATGIVVLRRREGQNPVLGDEPKDPDAFRWPSLCGGFAGQGWEGWARGSPQFGAAGTLSRPSSATS